MTTITTTVEVPTETGQTAVIDVHHDTVYDTYTIAIAGELIDQSPEAVTVAVQMAFLEIRSWRRCR